MADNKTDGSSPRGELSGEERRRNRRYLRNRKRPRRGPGGREPEPADPKRGAGGTDAPGQAGEQSSRQRRRRRARRESSSESAVELAGSPVGLDYVPPASVFIYTHVVRSGLRDAGYEFRSERFAATGVGRRLEDYRLDLSVLFPAEGAADQEAAEAVALSGTMGERDYAEDEYEYDDDYDEEEDESEEDDVGEEDNEGEDESMTSQDGV